MRKLTLKEIRRHGCYYCRDAVKKKDGRNQFKTMCPHASCPYRELDEYDSFEEFFLENCSDPMFLKHLFAMERHDKERQQKSS